MTNWAGWANMALQAYGAYSGAKENKKVAEEAEKDRTRTTYHTPYYNEAIAPLSQYFLSEAQKIYANRLKQYGMEAGDYSPYGALIGSIPLDYSGVGMPGSAIVGSQFYGASAPPMPAQSPSMSPVETAPPVAIEAARGVEVAGGTGMPEMTRYWEVNPYTPAGRRASL